MFCSGIGWMECHKGMYTVTVSRGRGFEGAYWLIYKVGGVVEVWSGRGWMEYHKGCTQFQ